jgi:O-antigen/teichoic acid export membrane protein
MIIADIFILNGLVEKLKIVKKIRENSYIIQIITLMSGTLMAQVIMFAFIPILTRIYTPSEFGLYSVFFALSSMVGLISSLRYEQAIMLPKSNRDAQALVFISIVITLLFSLIVGLALWLCYDLVLDYFEGNSYLVWLLSPSILIIGMVQIFDSYSTREELYKKIAFVRVMESVTTISTQGISRYFFALDGLIVGKILSNLFSLYLFCYFHIKKQTLGVKYLTKRRVKANLKRHESFPKYFSISSLLNSFSQQVPIFLFTLLFSPAIAGFYSLTARVMQVPILLVAGSTRSVFYQKASSMYANGENITPLYLKTTLGLIKLFIAPLLIILFFGQDIFIFLFGLEWVESGVIAQITIIWFMFVFISPPTSAMYNILNLQKILLLIQILTIVTRVVAIYLGFYIFGTYLASVVLFTAVSVIHNILFIGYIYYKIRHVHRL